MKGYAQGELPSWIIITTYYLSKITSRVRSVAAPNPQVVKVLLGETGNNILGFFLAYRS